MLSERERVSRWPSFGLEDVRGFGIFGLQGARKFKIHLQSHSLPPLEYQRATEKVFSKLGLMARCFDCN